MLRPILIILASANIAWALSCKDENGVDVDWYILYKIPYLQEDQAPVKSGFAYAYLSGPAISAINDVFPDEEGQWRLSKYTIKDRQSFLGETVDQIYSQSDSKDDLSFVIYNDSPPPDSGNGN